jgi:hypothetical protein
MKGLKLHVFFALAGIVIAGAAQKASAQVNIHVGIGVPAPPPVVVAPAPVVAVAPVCPYGYYDYAPYNCAAFGYYGPQWFVGGAFIGAGAWFHGPVGFHGYVDRRFDPRYGYRGYCPRRGERADWGRHAGWERNFHGSEQRVEYRHDNGHHYGEYKDHDHGDHGDHGHYDDHGHHDDHHDDHGHGRGHDHN